MFLLYFVNAMQSSILSSLTPYVTSDFQSHSLLTVIDVVSYSMTAALYIPVAKILDVWGRAEGFLLMIGFATLGLILMASSNGIATFCAAQVSLQIAAFIMMSTNNWDPGLLQCWIRRHDLLY